MGGGFSSLDASGPVWVGHSCPTLLTLVSAWPMTRTQKSKASDKSVRPTRVLAGPDLLPSLLPWCYIEKLEPLRCEVSEKRHLSIGVARENTGLVSFPGHYQMLAAGNLSEFIARQGLVAIELQSELALA